MNSATCRLSSPKHMRPWIPEDLIVTMYKQSLHKRTQIDILAQLNDVPKPVIEEILRRYGCEVGATRRIVRTAAAKHLWTVEEEAFLSECYESGMNLADIADGLGRTVFSVKARLNKLGINTGRRRRNESKNKACESAAGEKE